MSPFKMTTGDHVEHTTIMDNNVASGTPQQTTIEANNAAAQGIKAANVVSTNKNDNSAFAGFCHLKSALSGQIHQQVEDEDSDVESMVEEVIQNCKEWTARILSMNRERSAVQDRFHVERLTKLIKNIQGSRYAALTSVGLEVDKSIIRSERLWDRVREINTFMKDLWKITEQERRNNPTEHDNICKRFDDLIRERQSILKSLGEKDSDFPIMGFVPLAERQAMAASESKKADSAKSVSSVVGATQGFIGQKQVARQTLGVKDAAADKDGADSLFGDDNCILERVQGYYGTPTARSQVDLRTSQQAVPGATTTTNARHHISHNLCDGSAEQPVPAAGEPS